MTEVATIARLSEAAGAQGAILGGGTLLMREVNYRPQNVPRILRITDPVLREIRAEGDGHRIGAGVTMARIIEHPDLAPLAAAARVIGGPALRNMATVGGNLFAAHPYGDLAVALLALDAQVIWQGGRAEPLESFLSGRAHARGVVEAVLVPRLRGVDLRFAKVSRTRPKGVSVLSIAAALTGSSSRIDSARIAFGAMGPTPLRARSAEAALRGASLTEAGVAAACAACVDGLSPPDDPLASAWYRARVAPVHLKRLLLERR